MWRDWMQNPEDAPSRAELERDEAEARWSQQVREWRASYEQRFTTWCLQQGLDPECLGSVLRYEEHFPESFAEQQYAEFWHKEEE